MREEGIDAVEEAFEVAAFGTEGADGDWEEYHVVVQDVFDDVIA